jgi:hypothetical protein
VIRKRHGRLVDVDVAKLAREIESSRDWLANASGYRPDLFKSPEFTTA